MSSLIGCRDKKRLIAYRRNKDLQETSGSITILKRRAVSKNNENHKQSGKYSPCVSRLNNPRCKHVKQTKVTEQIEYLRFFIGLHAKDKILHIYSNVE